MAGTASGTCTTSPRDTGRARDIAAAMAFVLSLLAGSSRSTGRKSRAAAVGARSLVSPLSSSPLLLASPGRRAEAS